MSLGLGLPHVCSGRLGLGSPWDLFWPQWAGILKAVAQQTLKLGPSRPRVAGIALEDSDFHLKERRIVSRAWTLRSTARTGQEALPEGGVWRSHTLVSVWPPLTAPSASTSAFAERALLCPWWYIQPLCPLARNSSSVSGDFFTQGCAGAGLWGLIIKLNWLLKKPLLKIHYLNLQLNALYKRQR